MTRLCRTASIVPIEDRRLRGTRGRGIPGDPMLPRPFLLRGVRVVEHRGIGVPGRRLAHRASFARRHGLIVAASVVRAPSDDRDRPGRRNRLRHRTRDIRAEFEFRSIESAALSRRGERDGARRTIRASAVSALALGQHVSISFPLIDERKASGATCPTAGARYRIVAQSVSQRPVIVHVSDAIPIVDGYR